MYNMKKINFNIEDGLYKNFKKYCVDVGESMTDVLIDFIESEVRTWIKIPEQWEETKKLLKKEKGEENNGT